MTSHAPYSQYHTETTCQPMQPYEVITSINRKNLKIMLFKNGCQTVIWHMLSPSFAPMSTNGDALARSISSPPHHHRLSFPVSPSLHSSILPPASAVRQLYLYRLCRKRASSLPALTFSIRSVFDQVELYK